MSIRLGIVGADESAREVVETLMTLDEARIVAVCDRDLARAQTLAKRSKARAFGQTRAMLKPMSKPSRETRGGKARNTEENPLKTLDAICVLTSERNRAEAISLALQSGCDVFVAAPLAFSQVGAQNLLQCAQENGARIWTSQEIGFCAAALGARKSLQSRGEQVSCVHGAWKIGAREHNTKAARDAQILKSSAGCVAALRFFQGEIQSVFARASDGNISLNLGFCNGVLGAIAMSENAENALHFITRNGFTQWRENATIVRQGAQTQQIEYSNDAARAELRAWLQSLQNGRRTTQKLNAHDALQNLRVALAIAQSIKTNKPVRLGN